MEKKDFIKDNWYISNGGSYVKYSYIDNDGIFRTSEHILFGNRPWKKESGSFGSYKNVRKLDDLSKIQSFLPEGHPDRFDTIKTIKYEIY